MYKLIPAVHFLLLWCSLLLNCLIITVHIFLFTTAVMKLNIKIHKVYLYTSPLHQTLTLQTILKQHNKAKQKSKDKAKMILYDNVSLYSNLCLRNVNQLPYFRYNTHFHNSIITNARRSKNKQNFAGAQGQHFLNSFKKSPQWLHLRL